MRFVVIVGAGVGTVGAEVGTVGAGVGSRMGEDGGVLRKVEGKRLDTVDTVDTVESDGDGVDGREDGVRDGVVGTVRGMNRPDLSRRSEEARLSSVGSSSSDGGQR